MPEPRFRGESWQHSLIRADIAAAAAERERHAEAERTRVSRRDASARAVRAVAASKPPLSTPNPAPSAPEPQSARQPRHYAWHGGDHPHDFHMTPNESEPR